MKNVLTLGRFAQKYGSSISEVLESVLREDVETVLVGDGNLMVVDSEFGATDQDRHAEYVNLDAEEEDDDDLDDDDLDEDDLDEDDLDEDDLDEDDLDEDDLDEDDLDEDDLQCR